MLSVMHEDQIGKVDEDWMEIVGRDGGPYVGEEDEGAHPHGLCDA